MLPALRSILLPAWLVPAGLLLAQDQNVRIHGGATDQRTGKDIRKYAVVATDTADATERWGATVDLKGQYELKLPFDRVYHVVMSAPGHWDKSVLVDMHGVEPEMRRAGFSLLVDLELMEPMPIADTTLIGVPMGVARYSPRKRNMVWDEAYTKRIKQRWEAVRKD